MLIRRNQKEISAVFKSKGDATPLLAKKSELERQRDEHAAVLRACEERLHTALAALGNMVDEATPQVC